MPGQRAGFFNVAAIATGNYHPLREGMSAEQMMCRAVDSDLRGIECYTGDEQVARVDQ